MRRKGRLVAVALVVTAALSTAGARGAQTGGVEQGGVFRVVTSGIDSIDPAITFGPGAPYLNASCALLLRGASVPEVATGQPTISPDGKTYTFTLRKTFRFNTGTPLTAESFAHAIDRDLAPAMHSPGAEYFRDIVGADDVLAAKATHARGLEANGYKLTIRLTHRIPDFAARLTITAACAVPPSLPADPEGAAAPLSGAGPYYIAEYVPGRKLVLRPNPSYHGSRPHHVDRIDVTIVDSDKTALEAIVQGQADWGDLGDPSLVDELSAADRSSVRVVTAPGLGERYVVMKTSRALFRDNAALRRAVNYALDRPALLRARGGTLAGTVTDHYLPAGVRGFRPTRIYPLRGPDLPRARSLARGRLRTAKAVLYAQDSGPNAAEARIVKRNLQKIGLKVEIHAFPGEQLFQRLFTPAEPYDFAFLGWFPAYVDPYDFLNSLLEGRQLKIPGNANIARFDSPRFNRLLGRAAQLRGKARYRTYGDLDVELARDAAPLAAYMQANDVAVTSPRTGCLVDRHVDLASVCLR